MSEEFLHGVKVTEISQALRTLTTSSTAVIGLVATASDADNATFPLNKPTLLTGITSAVLAKAGKKGANVPKKAASASAHPFTAKTKMPILRNCLKSSNRKT